MARPTRTCCCTGLLLISTLVAASQAGDWMLARFDAHLSPGPEPLLQCLLLTAIAVYVVLLMLPFVPGVEIGLALLVVFGTGRCTPGLLCNDIGTGSGVFRRQADSPGPDHRVFRNRADAAVGRRLRGLVVT